MSQEEPGGYALIEIAARDLPSPHTRDHCDCGCETGYLSRYIKVSGATAIRWVCVGCEGYNTAGDLPRWLLGDVPLAAIPIRVDFSDDGSPECAVCGVRAVEYHHWAPRAIFPDWPDVGVYVCQFHHDDWHKRMRAHGLRWPSDRAA